MLFAYERPLCTKSGLQAVALVGAAGSGPAIPVLIKNLILALAIEWLALDPSEARTSECFKSH